MVVRRRGIHKIKSKVKWFSIEGPSDQQHNEVEAEMTNLKDDGKENIINHI